MSVRVGVVVFPGTNCELDVAWVVEELGGELELGPGADGAGTCARISVPLPA